jgi:hypothetical protein
VPDAVAYCCRRPHLRRTLRIALVVGVVLNAINESGPIAHGQLGAGTWVRVVLNFLVPFVVSNVGLLSGRVR